MTHHVVRLADHFFAGKAADLTEGLIGLGDLSLEIRTGVNEFVLGQQGFHVGDRQIFLHNSLGLDKKRRLDTNCIKSS